VQANAQKEPEPFKDLNEKKWGYKDETGAIIIPPKYDWASKFSEGLALVELNRKSGFIDKTGAVIIPLEYDAVASFSEGLASVSIGGYFGGKWGFIDKTGKVIIPIEYNGVYSF